MGRQKQGRNERLRKMSKRQLRRLVKSLERDLWAYDQIYLSRGLGVDLYLEEDAARWTPEDDR